MSSEPGFELDPGSEEARERGCICDPQPGPSYRVEKQCPLHGLAELMAHLDDTQPSRPTLIGVGDKGKEHVSITPGGRISIKTKEREMKKLAIYGASDDLIEVEGDVPGADEYNGERAKFVVAGLRVAVEYGAEGCWGITVRQVEEDVPVTAEDMALSVNPRMDGSSGYSMRLDMLVPDDAYVTVEEQG